MGVQNLVTVLRWFLVLTNCFFYQKKNTKLLDACFIQKCNCIYYYRNRFKLLLQEIFQWKVLKSALSISITKCGCYQEKCLIRNLSKYAFSCFCTSAFYEGAPKCTYLTLTRCQTFWEDFTCLDVSQCMLNKSILSVAAKYVNSDLSGCLVQFLSLGMKVCLPLYCSNFAIVVQLLNLRICQGSMWCRKHLKMTCMSKEESQEEEHCSFFYQVDKFDILSGRFFKTSDFDV